MSDIKRYHSAELANLTSDVPVFENAGGAERFENSIGSKFREFNEDLKDLKHKNARELFSVFAHHTSKWNPAAIVPRAAGLALVRANFVGLARKLYPALLTDTELKNGHFDLENARKVKAAWNKEIKEAWNNLGGDMSSLETAVRKGHDRPIFKTKKMKQMKRREETGHGVDGNFQVWVNDFDLSNELQNSNLGDNWDESNAEGWWEAAVAAGGGIVVATINGAAKKGGAQNNPYVEGSAEADKAKKDSENAKNNGSDISNMPPLGAEDEETLRKIKLAALEDRKKHGLDSETYEKELDQIMNPNKKYIKYAVYGAIGIGVVVLIRALIKNHK